MTTDTNPLIFLMGTTGQTGRLILEEHDRVADKTSQSLIEPRAEVRSSVPLRYRERLLRALN